ncbi:formate C-acetyltransferase/glycerol dehydratase family glycyl radical enzyme [Candidatus Atribacteria bacterium HGW-Atribacteria-1]|nr:MAG: formate C-acetyltransferase/glycerol dehydratase family glycyl radical enzyme [Candidatus Atribacteria bacterium HGW-Atribacteria-1]
MDFGVLSKRVKKLRDKLVAFTPTTCIERARIVTDFYKRKDIYKYPVVIQRAMVLDEILRKMTIIINEDELIVGNRGTNIRPGVIFPEMSVDWIEKELDTFETRNVDKFITPDSIKNELREVIIPFWKGKTVDERSLFYMPDDAINFLKSGCYSTARLKNGMGHFMPDYENVLKEGLSGIKNRAQEELNKLDFTVYENVKKANFLKAVIITSDAAIAFGRRFANKAKKMAKQEKNEKRIKELRAISNVCNRVPEFPANSFYEALQSLWFCHVIINLETDAMAISPGRFDQYMYPYFRRDINEELLTKEEARELLECLWIKFPEMVELWDESFARYSAGFGIGQNIILGGINSEGEDVTNELSYICLYATARLKITQPNLSVRIHNRTSNKFLKTVCEVIKVGTGMPQLFSDNVIIKLLINRGVLLKDARNYAILGCVEPTIPGKVTGNQAGGYINLPKLLELALNNGTCLLTNKKINVSTGNPRTFRTFEEIVISYKKQVEFAVKEAVKVLQSIELAYKDLLPTPFISSVIKDCIGRGKDVSKGGAVYNFSGLQGIGIGTVADSLAAIRKFVFEDNYLSIDTLLGALNKNFKGFELLQQKLINKAAKYGNDDDYVDILAKQALDIYFDEVEKYTTPRGGIYHPGAFSVSANVAHGLNVGATPDGRLARKPISDGVSPSPGRDVNGPTAVIKSVGKLDHIRASNGSLLNQRFHPMLLKDEKGLQSFAHLIRTYLLDLEGMHVQFNVVSSETLKKAQVNPNKYKNLIIRVAGYSAFFVDLSKELQEHIIERTEFNSFY